MKKLGGKRRLPGNLLEIKADLLKKQHNSLTGEQVLSRDDDQLLREIRLKTIQLNANNVTRTKAYLDFYRCHPEIHWAFLGHMVSRNGGWNMTDLKGDLLSRLMNEKTRETFFSFLERGNWLIFQDAYPQFLLYRECLRQNRNLFYLLPYLNISVFMEVMWNQFWKKRDCYLLAIALIINEQSYLEKRIVQNPLYKNKVLHKFEFVVQDLLSFNHILFPFERGGHKGEKTALSGQTLRHFDSLHERIMLGKRLYSLLFYHKEQWEKAFHWAVSHPHTGSRKDYWQDVFNDVNDGLPGAAFTRRLKGCKLRTGAHRLFSPKLEYAWKNVEHKEAELGDWFNHWRIVEYLQEDKEIIKGEIVGEYCETLEKLELVALAKKAIFS
ncbi:DUF2515 family protein [Bacillus sp. FJAT-49754]|nr:DUF2515 family protein [Lederbergia citrea]MBS4204005.1 DUF2515 family protein [Lederbergia citrea]